MLSSHLFLCVPWPRQDKRRDRAHISFHERVDATLTRTELTRTVQGSYFVFVFFLSPVAGVDLAFGLLPSVTSRLPLPSLWLVMWFTALILGGIGVQSAMLHNLYDSLASLCCVERRKSRLVLLVVVVLLLFLLGLSTVTQVSGVQLVLLGCCFFPRQGSTPSRG